MNASMYRVAAAAWLLAMASGDIAGAQTEATAGLRDPDSFKTPIKLFTTGLGPFARKISTTSSQAQAYFNQGVQFLYAFTPEDAARSFREAQRRDPSCAMCYWGEAWAWGPYLNGAMSASDAPLAYSAIQRAVALRARATEIERALIDAMALRYAAKHDRVSRSKMDSAYADAMARVHTRFPKDAEVGTLYAEALMLLLPRRGPWDIDAPPVQRIHSVLEGVLAYALDHPGACHLFVHATESTVRPAKAEKCAELLGASIPGASHINHMPSHTFNRVGRWGDAVRANIQAWHSDVRAEWGEGFAIYPSHNLHMLFFAASYDGQGAIAVQAAKDYEKIVEGGVFYQALTLVRFGRFDEVLELEDAPESPFFRALWQFARGYAHLRVGEADNARAYLERVQQAAKSIPDSDDFRGHTAAQLLGITGGILRGELLRHEKKLPEAIAAFEAAVKLEDDLRYDEPEPLPFSARQWLGAALLEAGRAQNAERVYRDELADHPRNGWSLFGLAQALEAQGKGAEASKVRAEFEQAWARSDTVIRASRF